MDTLKEAAKSIVELRYCRIFAASLTPAICCKLEGRKIRINNRGREPQNLM